MTVVGEDWEWGCLPTTMYHHGYQWVEPDSGQSTHSALQSVVVMVVERWALYGMREQL